MIDRFRREPRTHSANAQAARTRGGGAPGIRESRVHRQTHDQTIIVRKQGRQIGMAMQEKSICANPDKRFRPMIADQGNESSKFRMDSRLASEQVKLVNANTLTPKVHPSVGIRQRQMPTVVLI